MLKTLLRIVRPFSVIARELTILRELYEAELAARPNPVYRVTEKPRESNTEVLDPDGSESPAWKKWRGEQLGVED
jgi:hypothetical protein